TDSTGTQAAVATLRASALDPVLRLVLKIDGTVESQQLIPTFGVIKKAIFEPMCLKCHQPDGDGSDVVLDDYRALLDSPRDLVLPGNPEESGLMIAVTRTDKKRMPPPSSGAAALTDEQVTLIRGWISGGAVQ
ncbi:MAG TPA: c-type cytochrome domain-containing protein, partial [Bdellovibrionota bacterium]|nr:c-type cytochrome domain-containing protein [Bdellovibrionota bacterium]